MAVEWLFYDAPVALVRPKNAGPAGGVPRTLPVPSDVQRVKTAIR